MLFRFITLLLLAAGLARAAEAPALTPRERTELCPGGTLAGWIFVTKDSPRGGPVIWSTADGVVRCAGRPFGYARTAARYRDFALHFEWRWPSKPGNSGVFVHLTGPDQVWPTCLEVQLKAEVAGSIRANGGAKVRELDPAAKDPINVALRRPGVEKPAGEWNTADVVCRGDTITVRINGVLENEVTAASVASGAIALQAEGTPVEFRHLFVEPLHP